MLQSATINSCNCVLAKFNNLCHDLNDKLAARGKINKIFFNDDDLMMLIDKSHVLSLL